MDPSQAARNLEVIRTLMERTARYRLLTAWAGLAAGASAFAGAGAFLFLDPADPRAFGAVWGLVFVGATMATIVGSLTRGRERGEAIWSRSARAVVFALNPGLVAAAVLTASFFARGDHLLLPGVWMLCLGQGALATSAYAPRPVAVLGAAMLVLGGVATALGPAWAIPMMAVGFGGGHCALGGVLLLEERREARVRLHREIA
jgi:hypothetical protein